MSSTCLFTVEKLWPPRPFLSSKELIREWENGERKENHQARQNYNTLAIRQSQGPLFSSSSRYIDIVLFLIWELFSRYSNPYQVEEVNCMLPTSKSTPDHLEAEGWWQRFPKRHSITSSLTNQKKLHALITHPATLTSNITLKILSWKSLGSSSLLSISCPLSSLGAL